MFGNILVYYIEGSGLHFIVVYSMSTLFVACPSICQLHRLKGDNQKDSLRLIEHLAPRWEQLGITLDFDPRGVHVDLIKKECTNEGPVGCCNRVLKDWLNGQGARAYQPPTWANFITVLEEMEEFHLVRSLQTYFCTGPDWYNSCLVITDCYSVCSS